MDTTNYSHIQILTYIIVLLVIVYVIYKIITYKTNKERIDALKAMTIVLVCSQIFRFLNKFLSDYISYTFLISAAIAIYIAYTAEKLFIKK